MVPTPNGTFAQRTCKRLIRLAHGVPRPDVTTGNRMKRPTSTLETEG
nr:MAG TPA: hypothetical protein [Caudoviricetes sp.]